MLHDELRDRVVVAIELLEGNPLTALKTAEDVVPSHQDPLVDVVRGVDGREGLRDRDPDAAPLLGLDRRLARAAHSLAKAGHDDFEVAVVEGFALENPFPFDDHPGVRLAREIIGPVVEADPRGRHDVGIDVVQQIVGEPERIGAKVELAAQLPSDQLRVLREKQDAFPRREPDDLRWPGIGFGHRFSKTRLREATF